MKYFSSKEQFFTDINYFLPGAHTPQSSPRIPFPPLVPNKPGQPSGPGIPGVPGKPRSPGGPRILIPFPGKPFSPVQQITIQL